MSTMPDWMAYIVVVLIAFSVGALLRGWVDSKKEEAYERRIKALLDKQEDNHTMHREEFLTLVESFQEPQRRQIIDVYVSRGMWPAIHYAVTLGDKK